jgi:hypothetical protein
MGATRRSRANTRRTLAAKKEYETLGVKLDSQKKQGKTRRTTHERTGRQIAYVPVHYRDQTT